MLHNSPSSIADEPSRILPKAACDGRCCQRIASQIKSQRSDGKTNSVSDATLYSVVPEYTLRLGASPQACELNGWTAERLNGVTAERLNDWTTERLNDWTGERLNEWKCKSYSLYLYYTYTKLFVTIIVQFVMLHSTRRYNNNLIR